MEEDERQGLLNSPKACGVSPPAGQSATGERPLSGILGFSVFAAPKAFLYTAVFVSPRTLGEICSTQRWIERLLTPLCLILSIFLPALGGAQTAANRLPPPVRLTAQQDHKRIMDLLHITSLRQGADGNNRQAPNAANYDESKANPYPNLPDPLVLKNGKKVTTAEMWWKKRRPEIVEDFDREIYGRVPEGHTQGEVGSDQHDQREERRCAGHHEETRGPRRQFVVPADHRRHPAHADHAGQRDRSRAGDHGVRLRWARPTGWSRSGEEAAGATTSAPGERKPVAAAAHGRGGPGGPGGGPSWQQQVLAKGWGYAIIIPTSIQADNGAGLTRRHHRPVQQGPAAQARTTGARCAPGPGAPAAPWTILRPTSRWTPGRSASRATRAMARRPSWRWPTTRASPSPYVSSSGEGGAKLSRRNFGELVENVAAAGEYHWMAGNFLKYAGPLTGTICRWIPTS